MKILIKLRPFAVLLILTLSARFLVFPMYLYNNMICIGNFDNLTNHLPDLN